MKTAIIRYNAGNIQSVAFALERLQVQYVITDNPEEIAGADRVIFPGVGQAHTTMQYLREKKLDTLISNLRQPVLGICLGMQLLCRHSEEGNTPCIGIFNEEVKKFQADAQHKVPHMGWNRVVYILPDSRRENDYLDMVQLRYTDDFYFVHSYYIPVNSHTAGFCKYIKHFSAIMQKDNFLAVQFHPEKSGKAGERILHYFLTSFCRQR